MSEPAEVPPETAWFGPALITFIALYCAARFVLAACEALSRFL